MYFGRNREDRMASTNGIIPRGRLNADGRRERWGVPGRTLEAVLDHIETGNTPRLEYPARPSFSRRRGSFLDAVANGGGDLLIVGLRFAFLRVADAPPRQVGATGDAAWAPHPQRRPRHQ